MYLLSESATVEGRTFILAPSALPITSQSLGCQDFRVHPWVGRFGRDFFRFQGSMLIKDNPKSVMKLLGQVSCIFSRVRDKVRFTDVILERIDIDRSDIPKIDGFPLSVSRNLELGLCNNGKMVGKTIRRKYRFELQSGRGNNQVESMAIYVSRKIHMLLEVKGRECVKKLYCFIFRWYINMNIEITYDY